MTIQTNAQGKERKRMVLTIAKWLDEPVRYAGAPTFNYEVGGITIDKDASITIGNALSDEATDRLLQHLVNEGFDIIQFFTSAEENEQEEDGDFTISSPRNLYTDEAVANLHSILAAKKNLICKALGISDVPVIVTDEKISFPWFDEVLTPEELEAYEMFICKLCDFAGNQKRINAKEKEVDNEKYAFRCFLLRLGFIGDVYKPARKILLQHLSGSSAFKAGSTKGVQ